MYSYTYTNGRMSEEDKKKYQEYMKSRMKSHIFQGYKDVAANRWKEITLQELKNDFPNISVPKFYNKEFYFLQQDTNTGEYIINSCYAFLIFYLHTSNEYVYLRGDRTVTHESKLYASSDDAMNTLREMEKKRCGDVGEIVVVDRDAVKGSKKIRYWKLMNGL